MNFSAGRWALLLPLLVWLTPSHATRLGEIESLPVRLQLGPGGEFAAAADINGDGRPDLLVTRRDAGELVCFPSQGEAFGRAVRTRAGSQPVGLAPADFDGDGRMDVAVGDFDDDGMDDAVVAGYGASEVLVLMGDARRLEPVRLSGFENPWGLAVADFNRDRHDDLAVVDQGATEITVFLSRHGR